MKYHVFVLVWGEPFAGAHLELALPFLLMPGNLPALAAEADVDFHIYTDRETEPMVKAGSTGLDDHCRRRIHIMEDIRVRGVSPLAHAEGIDFPEYKYVLQRECVAQLYSRKSTIISGPIIIISALRVHILCPFHRAK